MARIRSIKPEFWVSEQLAECSVKARLTFIGLWNFCDDNGVHPAKPRTLKALLYPMDEGVTPDDVADWMNQLIHVGLVALFEHEGERYWHVTGWTKHQKIDRPSFKHPAPPTNTPTLDESSSSDRRTLDESSSNDHRAPPPGVERSGEEGNGKKRPSVSSARPTIPCPYEAIVDSYHERLPDLPRVKVMPNARQQLLRKRWAWVLSSTKTDGKPRASNAEEALDWFGVFFARAAKNDFLMGRTPRSAEHANWQCDLDYLLSDRGLKQVLEKTEAAA